MIINKQWRKEAIILIAHNSEQKWCIATLWFIGWFLTGLCLCIMWITTMNAWMSPVPPVIHTVETVIISFVVTSVALWSNNKSLFLTKKYQKTGICLSLYCYILEKLWKKLTTNFWKYRQKIDSKRKTSTLIINSDNKNKFYNRFHEIIKVKVLKSSKKHF